MPTVVLMTYEFPPSGGGGVQRCAKFARYLPELGWTPVVVTSAPVPGRPYDESLLEGISGITVARLRPRRVSTLAARALRDHQSSLQAAQQCINGRVSLLGRFRWLSATPGSCHLSRLAPR